MESGMIFASVLITNYNYEAFISEAIDSVLKQTYSNLEVIVVDDGSSDRSKDRILSYQNQIVPIFKENGGHTSAINTAFKESKGDIIFLLDADDTFHLEKVEQIIKHMQSIPKQNLEQITDRSVLIYHPLQVVDEKGDSLGFKYPRKHRSHPENMYSYACKYKFLPFVSGPTSGIAFTRRLGELIFPLPDKTRLMSGEDFIVRPASLLGEVYGLGSIHATYRLHGNNDWFGREYGKSKEWLTIHEEFLNQKLLENGKEPVISFFDSIYSRRYYQREGSATELFSLALRVIKHTQNLKVFRFFVTTLLMAAKLHLKKQK